MKNRISFFKKTVISLALLLAATAGAFAQTTWSGAVNFTSSQTISNNVSISGNVVLNISSGVTVTVTGVISGSSTLRFSINGGGTLIMAGANTYSGLTYVNDATLQIGNGTSGSYNSTMGISLNSASSVLRFNPGADMEFSKVISGDGKVEKIGSNSLRFTGNNTYKGITTIDGGYLYVGWYSTTGSIDGDINIINGSLAFLRSNDYTYSGVISGGGRLIKHGSEKLILTGTNTYQGGTYIQDGTLQIGDGTSGSIASSSGVGLETNTAIFDISKGNQTVRSLNASSSCPDAKVILGARTLTIDINTGMQSFYGQITGTGGITKTGDGTLILAGANSYTGKTTISAGGLLIGINTETGSIASNNIENNGELCFCRTNDYTYAGVISGSGKLYKWSSGRLILTGTNTYQGATIIDAGTLQIGNGSGGSISSSSVVNLGSNTAILDVSKGNQTIKGLTRIIHLDI